MEYGEREERRERRREGGKKGEREEGRERRREGEKKGREGRREAGRLLIATK